MSNRRHNRTDGDKHMDVDLPIFDSRPEVLDVVVVGEAAAVMPKPSLDLSPLILSQESGTFENPECQRSMALVEDMRLTSRGCHG